MVQCSFCSSTKSQRYVYMQCNHFVCVNCAALRSGDTLMCCNKSTVLDESTKSYLATKKLTIINNLQNQYEYEKTDLNKMSFDEIQKKLTIINQIQGQKLSKRQLNDNNVSKSDEIIELQQYEKLYANQGTKMFQRNLLQANTQTPIKLISKPTVQIKHQNNNRASSQIKRSSSSKKLSNLSNQVTKLEQIPFSIKDFIFVLQNQLDFIKVQFQLIHEYLKKVQNDTVQQIKVYFEEYVNLIQKDYNLGVITSQNMNAQKERLKNYLQQTILKSQLQEIKKKLFNEDLKLDRSFEKNNIYENKNQQVYDENGFQKQFSRSNIPLQSGRPDNYNFSNRIDDGLRMDLNEAYFENLHLNTMRDPSNNFSSECLSPQPATTNRNLDKIYRKLEESRSKLQQRIQMHNQFINKRCTRMSNI